MQNSKRFKKLCFQLLVLVDFDVFAVQSNFITRGIALKFDAFIVSLFLKFLDTVEVFSANNC